MKCIFKKTALFLSLVIPTLSFADIPLINGTKTLSKSSQYVKVVFNVADESASCYANVYNGAWPNEYLAHAEITISADNPAGRILDVIIPNKAFAYEKNIVIDCAIPSNAATLVHKLPAPPSIRIDSELVGNGPDKLRFKADTFIDNHEPDGACHTYQYPESFNLLGTNTGETKIFFADFFILDKQFSSENFHHAHVAVLCQNSGGLTISNHVWEKRAGVFLRVSSTYEHH